MTAEPDAVGLYRHALEDVLDWLKGGGKRQHVSAATIQRIVEAVLEADAGKVTSRCLGEWNTYREACEYALGAARQAAQLGRWERACRLIEATVAQALGMPSLLATAEHHPAPDFTDEERRQNERWAREHTPPCPPRWGCDDPACAPAKGAR
jgi:hypothetical protein